MVQNIKLVPLLKVESNPLENGIDNERCEIYEECLDNVNTYIGEMERLKRRLVVDDFIPSKLTITPFRFLKDVLSWLKNNAQLGFSQIRQPSMSILLYYIDRGSSRITGRDQDIQLFRKYESRVSLYSFPFFFTLAYSIIVEQEKYARLQTIQLEVLISVFVEFSSSTSYLKWTRSFQHMPCSPFLAESGSLRKTSTASSIKHSSTNAPSFSITSGLFQTMNPDSAQFK